MLFPRSPLLLFPSGHFSKHVYSGGIPHDHFDWSVAVHHIQAGKYLWSPNSYSKLLWSLLLLLHQSKPCAEPQREWVAPENTQLRSSNTSTLMRGSFSFSVVPLILENSESLRTMPAGTGMVLIWIHLSALNYTFNSKSRGLMNMEIETVCLGFLRHCKWVFWFDRERKSTELTVDIQLPKESDPLVSLCQHTILTLLHGCMLLFGCPLI